MAVSTTTGIFSGLDTTQIISQLMTLERRPLQQLSAKKTSSEAKISSLGSLSSSLSSLKDTLSALKKLSVPLQASSSDTTVFTASASSSASEGTYNLKVSNLATKQSISSQSFSATTDAVADLSVYATQKMKIQVGTNSAVDIMVDATNNTLDGIKDAINNANAGVKASVINDGSGYRLILSSDTTGAANRITVTVDEDYDGTFEETPAETDTAGLSVLAFNATYDANGLVAGGTTNLTQSQAAVDASLVIDGLTVTRGSNTITDLVTNVTLNLLADSAGNTLTLTVSKDTSQITSNINSFVAAYNAAMGLARSLSASTGGQRSILSTESIPRLTIQNLRSSISTSFSGNSPAGFGLEHDKDMVLSVDSGTLQYGLDNDLQGVIDTFDGLAESLETTLDNYIKTMIPARTDGLATSVDRLEERMDALGRRIAQKELNYRQRFILLEETLGKLQQSTDVLNKQLKFIPPLSSTKK